MFDTINTLFDGASKLAPGPLRPDELQLLQRLLQPGETSRRMCGAGPSAAAGRSGA